MTATELLAAAAVPAAFAVAGVLVAPAIRRTELGLVHPALAWLALHGLFFGFGAVILVVDGSVGSGVAWYVSGAAIAMATGVLASDRLAAARAVTQGSEGAPAPVRPAVVVGLLGIAFVILAPTLLAAGIPLLSHDPTAARADLAGTVIQPLRVALPAAAAIALLAAAWRPTRRRVAAATIGVAASLAFTLLLASRFLAAELTATLVVAWILSGRRVPVRAIVALAIVGSLAFAGIQLIRAPELAAGREVAFAIERTASRILLVQPRTLDALQDAIPAETPYFGGLTWLRRLGPAIGRPDVPNLGYWIYPRIFPDQTDLAVAGYAAPGLIGEASANFGPAGLLLFFRNLRFLLRREGFFSSKGRENRGISSPRISAPNSYRWRAWGKSGLRTNRKGSFPEGANSRKRRWLARSWTADSREWRVKGKGPSVWISHSLTFRWKSACPSRPLGNSSAGQKKSRKGRRKRARKKSSERGSSARRRRSKAPREFRKYSLRPPSCRGRAKEGKRA